MIEKQFIKKDGSQGSNFSLESSDVFVFQELKKFDGKFGERYTALTQDGKYINLTGGQASFFTKHQVNPGTKVRCEEYTNNYGTFVGLRFDNNKDNQTQQVNTSTEATAGLPSLDKPAQNNLMSKDEEACLNQLLGNPDYNVWKEYAKADPTKFGEALDGVSEKLGVNIDLSNGDKVGTLYGLFLTKL